MVVRREGDDDLKAEKEIVGAGTGSADPRVAAIDVSNLTVAYERRGATDPLTILDGFNLSVKSGELLTIVGPSGCGKSTLLKVIANLVRPAAGEVRFEPKGTKPKIGFVFQDYSNALAPWRNAIRNVEFGLEIAGAPREERRERARHYLKLVGLEGYEQAYPRELSGGMQQRVQLARVLAYDPTILLLDEPFGSLDAQMRRVLQGDVRRILDELATTVIFVTHDIEEALYLGDRVLVFSSAPARIMHEIRQPERPTDLETFLQTDRCQQQRAQIWKLLRGEIADPASNG
jgi:NitT/TauT family transport system ATP-binding protein